MAKTIFCPACGEKCRAERDPIEHSDESIITRCSKGHGFAVTLNFHAETPDGTSIIGFQCDGTSAYELPDA